MHTLDLAINLLGAEEQQRRLVRVFGALATQQCTRALVRNLADIYYLTGRVFRGFIYLDAALDAPLYFVRQPNHLRGEGVIHIHKPEQIAEHLDKYGVDAASPLALEIDSVSYSEVMRLAKAMGALAPGANLSAAMRIARSVKTEVEQKLIEESGVRQTRVYNRIPRLYKEGMTDIELQIEIERASRQEGCLGIFRVGGDDMELFMGNVLTGENADTPSPYDFAMGGAGLDPSLPVGADGTLIRPGIPVMVDVNGDYTGYMTDMTRCYCAGTPHPEAVRANRLSAEICHRLADMMRPGVAAADLYNTSAEMARAAGLADSFMGHRSQAGFVGHGLGIEINELPVIAPRSKNILEAGNVIALEPKFVVPGLGAIGIENTYIVQPDGPARVVTHAPEDIIPLT